MSDHSEAVRVRIEWYYKRAAVVRLRLHLSEPALVLIVGSLNGQS